MREGLLLINLGSPDQPTTAAVGRYLRQFLMDRYVIDIHWSLRSLLVHGVIAPTRAPKSARAYQAIWTAEGSPLRHYMEKFAAKVGKQLSGTAVTYGMRYGRPSIRAALERLRMAGVESLNIVSLYPQFAKSSTLTAVEQVQKDLRRLRWNVPVRFLADFYERPEWTKSLGEQIRKENESFQADFLLMSYHGLPEHHVREAGGKGCLASVECCAATNQDNRLCYRAQCFATSRALAKAADWPANRYRVSFQSRLGRRPWIKPYSDIEIVELAKKGVKRVLVTCPSFVADCLETLEEIAIRMKHDFLIAGGEDLRLVPAVNDSDVWVERFSQMLKAPDLTWWTKADAEQLVQRFR